MSKEELLKLIDRYLIGDVSTEEENILFDFFESFQDSQEWEEKRFGSKELLEKKLELAIKGAIKQKKRPIYRNKFFLLCYKVAAAIIVILTIGIILNRHFLNQDKPSLISENRIGVDLSPGIDIATLTLGDGSVINLNDSARSEIVLRDGFVIQKNEFGQLVYNKAHAPQSEVTYNTLSTPKGGEYQVILPDGSKVWLNAETSLRFPTSFVGVERNVDLIGEAYFEVAKDESKRFKVNVKGMEVVALGTEFNVNAYEGDEVTSATLFEGLVSVNKESKSVLLTAGQNAQLNKSSGTLTQGKADLEAELAWKNGYFIFNNEDIKSIMIKLSRWYDAEIEYEGIIDNKRFTAIISRRSNISEILEILENTGAIHFKIQGRRVKVMV